MQGTVQVASRIKHGDADIVRSSWLLDCIGQADSDGTRPTLLMPLEPRYVESKSHWLRADTLYLVTCSLQCQPRKT